MKTIDRERLSKFLESSINHQDNPQSFNIQMQLQIEKYMKQNQRRLKQDSSKIRVQKMIDEDNIRREKLQQSIKEKLQKSQYSRKKLMKDYTKSLSNLNKHKKDMQIEKIKEQRRKQLQKSLAKIKQIEQKYEKYTHLQLNKSASENLIKQSASKIYLREEIEALRHEQIIKHLKQKKGIFEKPNRALKSLYQLKVKHNKSFAQSYQREKQSKLGSSLNKIQNARKKKQAMLAERVQKLSRVQQYQFQQHRSRIKEIHIQGVKKRNQLIKKQVEQINRQSSLTSYEQKDKYNSLKDQNKNGSVYYKVSNEGKASEKNRSYRKDIREYINKYVKQLKD